MKRLIFIVAILSNMALSKASTSVPFTLEDRDRLIRLEEKYEALDQRLYDMDQKFEAKFDELNAKFNEQNAKFNEQNAKFDSMQIQISDLKSDIRTLMYFVLGGMLGLVGFILWDRRTFLKPFESEAKELHKTDEQIIHVLKEQAKTNPSLAEILRSAGLL